MTTPPPPILRLEQICLPRLDRSGPLFDQLCLVVQPGEQVAILGPEAAGKSALLRLMAGLIPAQSGQVFIDGIARSEPAAGTVGMLFREPEQHFLTALVREEVALTPAAAGMAEERLEARIEESLQQAGLPSTLAHQELARLSSAQSARVALAALLAARPRLLLADEPGCQLSTAGETAWAKHFQQLQQEQNLTTVVVTSRPERAHLFAQRILQLAHGRLIPFPRA